ncbi:hypothetical protein [Streptomyces diastatochromogenes]|uniref:hypothetical protein n=1 Tax=Streptomyces diastatochromogenes TaxID=42236 RepID=UPI0036C7E70A
MAFVLRHGHRAGTAVAISALLITLSGCSGSQPNREYSAPESLCGTTVDAEELSDFLPAGKKVSTKETAASPTATRCSVSVDGKRIVYAAQEWWNDMSVLEFARGLTLEKVDQQTSDGRFAYSGDQAFGKAEGCRNRHQDHQDLYTAIQATGSKHKDAAAMRRLITAYTKAVEQSKACQ